MAAKQRRDMAEIAQGLSTQTMNFNAQAQEVPRVNLQSNVNYATAPPGARSYSMASLTTSRKPE